MWRSVMVITVFSTIHLLEHMIIKLRGGIEQPPEEMTCLAVLQRQKSRCRVEAKRLMEKLSVQSPSISIRQ